MVNKWVKFETFHTSSLKSKKSWKSSKKTNDSKALLRATQMLAAGQDVDVVEDVVEFIGNHECSKYPPALFNEDGKMHGHGTKATLLEQ